MRQRVRLPIDLATPATFDQDPLINDFTGATPLIFRGRAADVEIALFFQNAIQSIADISEVTMEIKTVTNNIVDTTSNPLVSISLGPGDFNPALTKGEWNNGSGQHMTFRILTENTAFDMTGHSANRKTFALICCAHDNEGEHLSWGTSPIVVFDDGGCTVENMPEPGDPLYLTAAQITAMLAGFAKLINKPGDSITLTSQNERWQVPLYVDGEDGELKTNKIGPLN